MDVKAGLFQHWRKFEGTSGLWARQFLAHLLEDDVDRLERADHYLEFGNQACLIPGDEVRAVDTDAIDFGVEFQHRRIGRGPLTDITEFFIADDLRGGSQVFEGDRLAFLWLEDQRRVKHRVVSDQVEQQVQIVLGNHTMPSVEGVGHPVHLLQMAG